VDAWKRYDSPIVRFRQYLEVEPRKAWSEEMEVAFRAEVRQKLLEEFAEAEKRKRPPVEFLFEDVFKDVEGKLVEQAKENKEMMDRWAAQSGEVLTSSTSSSD